MGRGTYDRAKSMMALVMAAFALPGIAAQQEALAKIGEYKSRGHGRKKGHGKLSRLFRRRHNPRLPHQGPQECARRAKHYAEGWYKGIGRV